MNKYVLVGLGNPGSRYEFTRHNAGKIFAAYLKQHPIEGLKVFVTDSFMNQSGAWIKKKVRKVRPPGSERSDLPRSDLSWLVVAHDDLDLRLGNFKIQFGKGPKGHNGVLSVEQALGTAEFWRVRLGVDNRPERSELGEEYVLGKFGKGERAVLDEVFRRAREELVVLAGADQQRAAGDAADGGE